MKKRVMFRRAIVWRARLDDTRWTPGYTKNAAREGIRYCIFAAVALFGANTAMNWSKNKAPPVGEDEFLLRIGSTADQMAIEWGMTVDQVAAAFYLMKESKMMQSKRYENAEAKQLLLLFAKGALREQYGILKPYARKEYEGETYKLKAFEK